MIQGNAYRELVALRRGQEIEIPDDVTPWAAEQLREEHVQILEDLPHPLVLTVEGFGRVVFCHGSPRRDDELVLVDSPMSRWAHSTHFADHANSPGARPAGRVGGKRPAFRAETCHKPSAFSDLADDQQTVVRGHTHMPYIRLVDRRLVIKPGSIGMPYGRAGVVGPYCTTELCRCITPASTSTMRCALLSRGHVPRPSRLGQRVPPRRQQRRRRHRRIHTQRRQTELTPAGCSTTWLRWIRGEVPRTASRQDREQDRPIALHVAGGEAEDDGIQQV